MAATPQPTPIGWASNIKEYRMKQGATGSIQVVLQVRADDGSPLPSYQGFTAKFSLYTALNKHIQDFTEANGLIIVYGDDTLHQVTIEILFKTAFTKTYPADCVINGDLQVTLPDGIEQQYPYQAKIHMIRSYTP